MAVCRSEQAVYSNAEKSIHPAVFEYLNSMHLFFCKGRAFDAPERYFCATLKYLRVKPALNHLVGGEQELTFGR